MDDSAINFAIESLSLKFLQFIWESTCGSGNHEYSLSNLGKLREFVVIKKQSSSNSSLHKKRKSILIKPTTGLNNFNKGVHLFKISDLISKFCKRKNYDAIK